MTSHSTVSTRFTQRPNVETETPKHKTLNNALVTTNEVLNTTCKYSANHAPSHTSCRNCTLTQPLQDPSQAQARLPPRTLPRPPPTNPPCPPPQTPTRMSPQLPPSMLRRTKQQERMVRVCSKGRGSSVHQVV